MSTEKDNLGLIGCLVIWIGAASVVIGLMVGYC